MYDIQAWQVPWPPICDWKIKESSICEYQRKDGKQTIGLEGKNVVIGWQGNSD